MPDQGTTKPTPHQRYPTAGIGARQTLLRISIVESERLPKETAGRGLASMSLPRNLEEEETRYEGTTKNILRITRARPGRRPVRLESHRPGRARARDWKNITRWAGCGLGQARSARPGSTPPPRVGPTRKNRWI